MKKREPSTSKTLNYSNNKKKKNRDGRERRKRTGPHLPNSLRKEIELMNKAKTRNSDDYEKEDIDSDDVNDVYEYEEAIPEEESGKNRRYDPVENFEYELPEQFQVLVSGAHAMCLQVVSNDIKSICIWHRWKWKKFTRKHNKQCCCGALSKVQQAGLFVHLRIGPYACAEWNYGGFPLWLHFIPGIQFRTTNDLFMGEMKHLLAKIVNLMKEENLFASQGGPIILAQVENEYGNVEGSYGIGGRLYVKWAAETSVGLNTSVHWVMCVQEDAPDPIDVHQFQSAFNVSSTHERKENCCICKCFSWGRH